MHHSPNKPEIPPYYLDCYENAQSSAVSTTRANFQNLQLGLLPLADQLEELNRLEEQVASDTQKLNRPHYLANADNRRFLYEHFGDHTNFFSKIEHINYQIAMNLHEQKKYLEQQKTKVKIQLEINEYKELESFGLALSIRDKNQLSYLLSELDSIRRQDGELPAKGRKPQAETIAKKRSFGYKKDIKLLTMIVDELTEAIGFLREPSTTAYFVKVATAEDLSLFTENIFIGCMTIQLKYVRECLETLFDSFIPATIEHSGLFISKSGNPIKAHNLVTTKCDHVKKRYAIDMIFKKHGVQRKINT